MKRILTAWGLLWLILLTFTTALAQEDLSYEDLAGRFRVPLGSDWQTLTLTDSYGQFQYRLAPLMVTFMAVDLTDDIQRSDAAIRSAFNQIGISIDSVIAAAGQGGWDLCIYSTVDGNQVAAAGKLNGSFVVIMLLTGDQTLTAEPPLAVINLLGQIAITSSTASELPATIPAFEAFAQELADRDNVSISIAASLRGQPIYQAGFGLLTGVGDRRADAETVYHWGSSTKLVTATALMQLVEQGLVDLDTPISTYLPYFPDRFGITVQHLLTHTNGLPESPNVIQYISMNDAEQLDPADIARSYVASLTSLNFEPGAEIQYGNYPFLLLGEIIHEVSGMPYVDYVRQHILQPLNMARTDFVYNPAMLTNAAQASDSLNQEDAMREILGNDLFQSLIDRSENGITWFNPVNVLPPWGGLHGPVSEQLNFLLMHANGGEWNGIRILQPETVAQMQELQVGTDTAGFGLAWRLNAILGRKAVGHQGGGPGISMEMQLFPQEEIILSVMTNRTGYNASAIVEAALNVVLIQTGQ